jgi:hypothetical protein
MALVPVWIHRGAYLLTLRLNKSRNAIEIRFSSLTQGISVGYAAHLSVRLNNF